LQLDRDADPREKDEPGKASVAQTARHRKNIREANTVSRKDHPRRKRRKQRALPGVDGLLE
jgi:hypothetical protein